MLILAIPAARTTSISAATIWAVCLRPVRAISVCTNDCTPRLTRSIPASTQARTRSGVTVPGAVSSVASSQGRPGISASTDASAAGSMALGVPPPEVDRFRAPCPLVPRDFAVQCVQVPLFSSARKHARCEVAVGTLLRTERIGNVNARHLPYDSVAPSLRSSASWRKMASVSNGRPPAGRSSDVSCPSISALFSNRYARYSSGSSSTMCRTPICS